MEPFITSSLSVAQKVPTRDTSGLITGVVIDSKVGPIKPTLITTPRQFLDLYTVNKSISKGDHPSLWNAFYISRFTDLIVTRATDSLVYPLIGIGSSNSSLKSTVLLPNGKIADQIESVIPHTRLSPGDYKSLWIQIDNVLFYGKNQMNPFEDGDGIVIGGTATAYTKGTSPELMELNGLGLREDYIEIELSQPLSFYNTQTDIITLNTDVYREIVSHFAGDGRAAKPYLNVALNEDKDGFTILSSSDDYRDSSFFQPVIDPTDPLDKNVYNLSWEAEKEDLLLNSPYVIGYTNVGTINTVTAWFSDVVAFNVEGETFYKWNLNFIDPVEGSQTYKVSDYPDAIDPQGNPIYYTWISEIRPEIILIKTGINSPVVAKTKPLEDNVGKSQYYIDSVLSDSLKLQSAAYAISAFEEYEDYRVQLYTGAGWYNSVIDKGFEAVASVKFGLNCVGIDPSIKDINLIKNYSSTFNSFYSIVHANAGKNTSVVGFQIPISPSCYYIESVAKNSTRNATYAPCFSKVNGTISESNLFNTFTKTQRDTLSKARVNVLMYDRTDGVAYINNNLLSDSSGSLIDEDQSIRIINDIRYDLEGLMKAFYSRFNTVDTRLAVEGAINSYFTTIIMPQTYTISGFNVICTKDNNSDIVVQNNGLKVEVQIALQHSIKYITILTNVIPVL